MKAITIRTLQLGDARQLLKFELDNRHWFERHIAPRAEDFYSTEGVLDHIHQFLAAYSEGRLHPCVIVEPGGKVLGRANLKEIHDGTAEVGYRIAQDHTGQGLASFALAHLVKLARTQWQLNMLVAYVAEQNLASACVLERGGFVRGARIRDICTVGGARVDGYRFCRDA